MRNVFVMGVAAALALCACDRAEGTSKPNETGKAVDADNTKRNERDRDMSTKTPGDQGNGSMDLEITQGIRQEVMKNDALSFEAKNVKIISENGVVTLRGSVKTQQEKDAIAAAATRARGVSRVDNMIEVKADAAQ